MLSIKAISHHPVMCIPIFVCLQKHFPFILQIASHIFGSNISAQNSIIKLMICGLLSAIYLCPQQAHSSQPRQYQKRLYPIGFTQIKPRTTYNIINPRNQFCLDALRLNRRNYSFVIFIISY